MKNYLMLDFYIQFGVLVLSSLLACVVDTWHLALYAIPVCHVLSFIIRLLLRYPKTKFFKIYGCYLLIFLISYLVDMDGLFVFCGLLSVFFGIGFIINCFNDYNNFEVEQVD